MKAILVIDMPEACADGCPVMCRARGINHRPTWCPLKPMPLKRETMVHWKSISGGDIPTHEPSGEDIGWNKCVEYLEGEENE